MIHGHTPPFNKEDPLDPETWVKGALTKAEATQAQQERNKEIREKLEQAIAESKQKSALARQSGGDHYRKMKIQPIEFIQANNLDFFQGNILKYICRFRDKNGIADLEKAKHYIELLIELEGKK